MIVDPLERVRDALAELPDEPQDATAETLSTLAAIADTLSREVDDAQARMLEISAAISAGDRTARTLADFEWLSAVACRCVLARDDLKTYTRAAIRARGFDPDRPAAGTNQQEEHTS